MEKEKAIVADAFAGFDRFAGRRNVTLTALLEATGRLFLDSDTPEMSEVIRLAKEIDRERRSRR